MAGGKNYLHVNVNGDVEPCVFVHFAADNIKEKSLEEVLTSDFFMADSGRTALYRKPPETMQYYR
ncbi:MAG: SPASM domain-containing protein [Actinomycetota bacterium]|nr:SPASM domain-containing protein [Actinomycetota bacterium]